MSNPTATDFVPCCGQSLEFSSAYSANKGACLQCCNDGKGFVLDATAVNGGPTTGTYNVHDGTFLQIVSVSMVPDHQFIKFGPTVYASGATYDERLPRNVCCTQTIGLAHCIFFNSSMVETGRGVECITASIGEIRIGGYYWFKKSITSGIKSTICAKPRAWHVLGGDETFHALSLASGATMRLKAWSESNTAWPMKSATECLNRCASDIDVTITISGLAGMVFGDSGLGLTTITDDEFSVTFTATGIACNTWGSISSTGNVTLAATHPTISGWCMTIGLELHYDDAAGCFFISSDGDEGDTAYGIPGTCADEGWDVGYGALFLRRFSFDPIECGANNITGTGTIEVIDAIPGTSLGYADVTVTVN